LIIFVPVATTIVVIIARWRRHI